VTQLRAWASFIEFGPCKSFRSCIQNSCQWLWNSTAWANMLFRFSLVPLVVVLFVFSSISIVFHDAWLPCCGTIVGFFCILNYQCFKMSNVSAGIEDAVCAFAFNMITYDFFRILQLQKLLTSIIWLEISYWHVNNEIRDAK